jgi:hypothetical protein
MSNPLLELRQRAEMKAGGDYFRDLCLSIQPGNLKKFVRPVGL